MEEVAFGNLNHILQAQSKDVIPRLCNEAFLHRHSKRKPKDVIQSTSDHLSINAQQATQVVDALSGLIKNTLFIGSSQPADIIQLFPSDFHKNLRDLLVKVFLQNLQKWREVAENNLVSLPRLVDFDWRVDVKSASDTIPRMSVPSCILQLKIADSPNANLEKPESSSFVNVELSKETLDTMLDGLGKIRDQLSAVSKT